MIAGSTVRRSEEFNAQNFSNTAWAFATLGLHDEELLDQYRLPSLTLHCWQKAPEVHARQPRSVTGSPTGEHEERLVWLAR